MRKMLSTLVLLFAVVACSFSFGLGQRRIDATPVKNCPIVECLDVHSWWTNSIGGTNCFSAQDPTSGTPGTQAEVKTTHAIPSIYYGSPAAGTLPRVAAGKFDRWIWDTSTATCDKIGGAYPSPQPVEPSGSVYLDSAGLSRMQCSPSAP